VKLPGGAAALSADAAVAEELTAQVLEELNVRAMELIPDESEMVERTLYPLLPVIGPRHGKGVGAVMAGARSGDWELGADGTVTIGDVTLQPDEFELTARARPGHEVAEDGDLLVAIDTSIDDELAAEGLAREVAHRLQSMRKTAGYAVSDRIRAAVSGDATTIDSLQAHAEWLASETLATSLELATGAQLAAPELAEELEHAGAVLRLAVARA
jgi:isoleucyl-tRNA synthetase